MLYTAFVCLVCLAIGTRSQEEERPKIEYPPFDGFFNNLNIPNQGAIDSHVIRMSTTAYSDGVYEPAGDDRPNALDLSQAFHKAEDGEDLRMASEGSQRNRTAFMVFFGQQVVEEIMDVQRPGCPPEFLFVPITEKYLRYANLTGKAMPLLRTRYDQSTGLSPNNPRQQLNENTPYLDGSLFYGPAKAWADLIREFEGGKLKAQDPNADIKSSFPADNDIRLPMANPPAPRQAEIFPVNRFYRLGNPRGNENPFLLTFGVIWFRWHNMVAKSLSEQNPNWNDETLFLEARKRVVAHHQKIVMYDWLPAWLQLTQNGSTFQIPEYKECYVSGYKRNVNPAIAHEFQTAAMRFGHTLIPNGVFKRTGNCEFVKTTLKTGFANQHAVRLCNAYWNSREAVDEDMDSLIRGMASQIAEKEDGIMVNDINGQLFGPLEFTRRDLAALNIMRARDHGVPDYNTVREHYGLKRRSFSDITDNPEIAERLNKTYGGRDDNIDLFVGGLLETTDEGPGELFKKITQEQFIRIRDGDRFWYENWEFNGLFTKEEVDEINNTTMHDIIIAVTNIQPNEIQQNLFVFGAGDPCPQPFQLNESHIEPCTEIRRFDYFSGSEVSFALSFLFLGLCVPLTIGILLLMGRRRKNQVFQNQRATLARGGQTEILKASEWVGTKAGERNVIIEFMTRRLKIHVMDSRKNSLRLLDLRNVKKIELLEALDGDQSLLQIKVPKESDLILHFGVSSQREIFIRRLEEFLRSIGVNRDKQGTREKLIYQSTNTKEIRQRFLSKVVKIVCLQVFDRKSRSMEIDDDSLNSVINVEITRSEFAEAMSLKPTSIFVRNMFKLLDKDNSGFLSFREFRDSFIIFSRGDAEAKTRLIFDMYDVRHQQYLSPKQFTQMIGSMLELGDASLDAAQVEELTSSMLRDAGLQGKNRLVYEDFKKVFNDYQDTIGQATVSLEGIERDQQPIGRGTDLKSRVRRTIIQHRNNEGITRKKRFSTVRLPASQKKEPDTEFGKKLHTLTRYISNYRLQIFWVTLYTLVVAGIFIERAYYYSFNREHAGLRRIAGNGVTVTRGAASAMMFTYASLLVTMSRNTITFLRETFLHRFIPFDSAIAFHKYIAMVALFFTVVHCVGHGINFYHISTQRAPDLNCLFRDFFRPTHVLAKFHYWLYQTITGFTGVVLTLIVVIMYVFASQYARRHVFKAFWFTHSFYVLLYIFMVLHGSGRLVQDPLFHYFFLGPAILFTLDKIVSFSMKKVELSVVRAELLPSDVTHLEFKRPLNFDYKSGQWVRIACTELSTSEYHPFTLTSAPHEDTLSLHIRAVGPWTNNLRKTYDINNRGNKPVPKLYVDGPFGEGHQDWYRYDVSVLVGGGIGVTPFASILKDIVFKSKTGARLHCKKVYFLWITRTQKQFEWMTDIIREVEESDSTDLVSVHIFITQFFQKFDLRTTMLYICERHFQKVANKSLFTGLRSITHFGRPELNTFLDSLQEEHKNVRQFGVFSCGPPPMTHSVESACAALNKQLGATYVHHFENF
ncbi:dual oxidase 2-like [Liolophura sinensis]|uniref:dual oxidase 2-like n=1 Tax=Liolophura sinensis TaxID=3198878 RepID=UPI0031593877